MLAFPLNLDRKSETPDPCIPFVFCARSRPTDKRDREQKHITKKLASFITSLAISTTLVRPDRELGCSPAVEGIK